MNDLPNECLLRIFELVEPIGQIVNCRLVCKRWCWVVNSLRVKSLVISSPPNLPNLPRWWYTYRPVNCRHLIRSDQTLESIQLKLDQTLFNHLKTLFIYGVQDKTLLTSFLSKFQQLEQLEVIYSKLKSETDCVLSLPSLRILNISDAINDRIVLHTPRLSTVKINVSHVEKIHFRFPEMVRHFESLRYNDQIKSFVNLEILKIKNINELDDNFLAHFGRLKELHWDTKREIFYVLKQQKRLHRRNALKLFYFGVQMDDSIPAEELKNERHQINRKAIELFAGNYSRMASEIPFVHQLDYCDLEDCFDDKIPTCLIGRFVNLDYFIGTRKIKYESQLIRILRQCGGLRSLALDSSLSQSFFNSLPAILPRLLYLIIKNEQKLNFNEFLLAFNCLELIYVRHSLSIDLVEKLFHQFKPLIFSFVYHAKKVRIISRPNEFKLEVENQSGSSFESLDDLLTHLKFNLSF